HEDRDRDSQGPKQYPAYLAFFIVQHNVPPFLEPRIHIRTDEPCHYVSKYEKYLSPLLLTSGQGIVLTLPVKPEQTSDSPIN
ncbi:MAG: hypothetical protein L6271_09050, partial [Desulfobacteraceae bacterium]|nr:hypothetical protein [Desulfobacteraceae bacterium]